MLEQMLEYPEVYANHSHIVGLCSTQIWHSCPQFSVYKECITNHIICTIISITVIYTVLLR